MYTYALYAPILCCLPSNQWSSCLSSSPIVVAPVVDVEWSANFFLLQKSSVDFMDDARLRHSPAHSCKTSNGLLERFKGGKKRLAVRVPSSHNIDLSDVRRCFKMPGNAAPHRRRRHRGSGRASERATSSSPPSPERIDRSRISGRRRLHSFGSGRPRRPPARPSNVRGGGAWCFDGRSARSERKTFLFHIHVGTLHRASRRRPPRPRPDAERERLFPYFHNLIDNDRNGTDGRVGWVDQGWQPW